MEPTALVADGVTKSFGATRANDTVSLRLLGGEVHALLGQNGAGKSTLVGVLTGRLVADAGSVRLDGVELPAGNPRAHAAAGIATVFQDLMLVPSMTALENIALALGLAASRTTRNRVAKVSEDFDLPVELDERVSQLELPQRQRIELLRALCQEPTILLLDEPTSLLPPTLIDVFLQKVRELADRGIAVLLITHRLDEARRIADRVTILRGGRVIGEYEHGGLPSTSELAQAMVGTTVVERSALVSATDEDVLEATELSVTDETKHRVVNDVSLCVSTGEILGVAGVDGNGQLELLEAMAGLREATAGRLHLQGEEITSSSSYERWHAGIHFVSGDRRRDGIVPTFSLADHFTYALGADVLDEVPSVLRTYAVQPPDPNFRADQLSGGNQQKLVIARACERDSKVLLLSYPTQGLDVQATANIRDILVENASRGTAIVFTSSDLDELLSISHRVVVMNRGRIVGEQDRDAYDRKQLAEWYVEAA